LALDGDLANAELPPLFSPVWVLGIVGVLGIGDGELTFFSVKLGKEA
jgi:hypothetical protein